MFKIKYINFFLIGIYQFSNSIVPILIFPILLYRYSADNYSQIVIGEGLNLVLFTFVAYSFDFSGVNNLLNKNNESNIAISKLFSRITLTRLLIYLIVGSLILVLIYLFGSYELTIITLGWSFVSLGYILQSFWFLQAKEAYMSVSLMSFLSRLLMFVIVFYNFFHLKYYMVPFVIGSIHFCSSLILFFFTTSYYKISFYNLSCREFINELRGGLYIFLGNISTLLYKECSVLIASFVGLSSYGITTVSIAEKTIKIIQVLTRLFNQYLYPKVIREFGSFGNNFIINIKNILITRHFYIIQFIFIFSIISLSSSLYLILTWYHVSFVDNLVKDIYKLTSCMCIGLFFGVLNYIYGTIGMNVQGLENRFFQNLLITGVIGIILYTILGFYFKQIGIALSFALSEVILFTLILLRNRIKVISNFSNKI